MEKEEILRERIKEAETIGYDRGYKEAERTLMRIISCLVWREEDHKVELSNLDLVNAPPNYILERYEDVATNTTVIKIFEKK